jgi:bifunctional non-homologous end joining protein LigD
MKLAASHSSTDTQKISGKKVSKTSRRSVAKPVKKLRSVRAGNQKLNSFITPMLASIGDQPFNDDAWVFEVKWDGYRAIAEVSANGKRLYSRNGLSFEHLYTKVFEALHDLPDGVILDGEIVVLNTKNQPDFQRLQQYADHPHLPIQYLVFDCLQMKGKSLTNYPLIKRKEMALSVIPENHPIIRYSEHFTEGLMFYKHVKAMNLEGMIAKRANSIYRPGVRTKDWLKIKNHNTQEAIIAGFTEPKGSRDYFGALVLAVKQHGKLRYIGHTGTGFSNQTLIRLYQQLKPLIRPTSPFETRIPVKAGVTWLEPVLVCNVKYTELTRDGILRHPVFQGLRVDKTADETSKIDKESELRLKKLTKASRKK